MTRCALGDVPKIPRHRSLRAIHSGSSSYGRRPTNVMLRTPSCCTSARTELSVSPEPTRSIVTASPRCLEDRRRPHDVLQPVQRDEAGVHEHAEVVVSHFRSGPHHVVVGPDPQPAELGPRRVELSREVIGVRVGVDEHPVGQSARHAVLELEPRRPEPASRRRPRSSAVSWSDTNASNSTGAPRSHATAFAAATSAWPGNPTSTRSVGSPRARRKSARRAAGVWPRVGDDTHLGPGAAGAPWRRSGSGSTRDRSDRNG